MKAGHLIDSIYATGIHPHRNEIEVTIDVVLKDGTSLKANIAHVAIQGNNVVIAGYATGEE